MSDDFLSVYESAEAQHVIIERGQLTCTDTVVGFFIVDFPVGLAMKAFPARYIFGGAIILFGLAAGLVPVCGSALAP